jgi:hypothetical protein
MGGRLVFQQRHDPIMAVEGEVVRGGRAMPRKTEQEQEQDRSEAAAGMEK